MPLAGLGFGPDDRERSIGVVCKTQTKAHVNAFAVR